MLHYLLLLLLLLHRALSQGCIPSSLHRQSFCLEDDAKKGYLLGSVVSQKRLKSLFGAQWDKASFAFLETDSKVPDYFRLDPQKGRLNLARDMDRDRMCAEARVCCADTLRCPLELKVVVTVPAAAGPTIETVHVVVLDKNDHTPRFPKARHVLRISENAPRGHELPLPLAEDPDAAPYSVRDYFVPDGGLPAEFALEKRRAPLAGAGSRFRRISELLLRLDRRLDRERTANYSFLLVAVDGGSPAFSGTASVVVEVEDRNDNGPRFLQASYEAVVNEGEALQRPLLTLQAKDPDLGPNAITRFALAPSADAETRRLFSVRPRSGEVMLQQPLDFERAPSHSFAVVARDQAGHSATATASVTVRVRDRNDERPKIKIGFVAGAKGKPSSPRVARIKENSPARQFVAIVQASDRDRGANGRVNCSLGNHRDDFLLEPSHQGRPGLFLIYARRPLDREKRERMDLQLRCQDGGRPTPQSAQVTLQVQLLDENDNAPRLRLRAVGPGPVRVRENQAPGTRVLLVEGLDPDAGDNGRVTFSMKQSARVSRALLRIDPRSGWVTTRVRIDREHADPAIERLPLVITARDHGKPAKTSSLTLTVRVEDLNDNAPVFLDNPMHFRLKENQPARFRVGEIRLVDKDAAAHISVRLDFARNGRSLPFRVVREGGKFFLNTTTSLDREQKADYQFFVVAVDSTDSGSHRTSGSVHVTVEDVNDNVPQIIFPKLQNKTIRLSFREQKGFDVLSINARDLDKTEDGASCFFELTPETTDILEIDPSSGTIRVHRTIGEADLGPHPVGVVVRDNGHPPRHSYVRFTLLVDRSKPHRQHRDVVQPPLTRPVVPWRSDVVLMVVLVLIIILLVAIVLIIVYVRHWRRGFLFLPDLLSPCYRAGHSGKRRRQEAAAKAQDAVQDKFLNDTTLGRSPVDLKMRVADPKESIKASSDSFSGLYSGTPTRQAPGVTTPFLPRDNSKYESLDPQRQAYLQQQRINTMQRGRGSLPDNRAPPDLTKRDYDSLLRGPGEPYHVYQTISPGEALIDDACDPMAMGPGAKKHSTLRRQTSSGQTECRPVRYNSEGDLTAGVQVSDQVGPRNASVKFVFPPKNEQVYTKTYPVMQTSFV